MTNQLDQDLALAIQAIADSRWTDARQHLSHRLENIRQLGAERLNLFLLAAIALLEGNQEIGLQLRAKAESTPCGLGEPRYLTRATQGPVSDILRTIESKWWSFNQWTESETTSVKQPLEAVDWEHVVEATLQGNPKALEGRWASQLNQHNSEKRFLSNFFALAYLLASDSSTYEDIKQQAMMQTSLTPPSSLVQALTSRGLEKAAELLLSGQWITSLALESDSSKVLERENVQSVGFKNFEEVYTEAFTDYRLHRLDRAQRILRRMDPSVSTLTLTQELLASVLQTAISVRDGDHVELQFHQDRLKELQAVPGHDPRLLDLGRKLFSSNGQASVGTFLQEIASGRPASLDPWNAFESY